MRIFDYSFLKTGMVPARLINLTANIYAMRERARYRMKNHPEIFSRLKQHAEFQSIKASNAIEGIYAYDARIRLLMTGADEPRTKDEKAIAGYMDALRNVDENFQHLDFHKKDILALHRTLLSHTDEDFGGQYKKKDNVIVEIDHLGNRRVRYIPLSAKETPEAMEQLEISFIVARSESGINELLLIPCAILDFLCIHPFLDGNGRVSRLLSLLLLYKANFDIGKYISFESDIYKWRDLYYGAIQTSQIGWNKNENDYFRFVEHFLYTLFDCYRALDNMFEIEDKEGKFSKKARIEAMVLRSHSPVSKSQICESLPDVSVSTIEVVLGQMVKEGKVKKVGPSNRCQYIRND